MYIKIIIILNNWEIINYHFLDLHLTLIILELKDTYVDKIIIINKKYISQIIFLFFQRIVLDFIMK